MKEFELIAALRRKLPPTSSRVELGIGDDAAVLSPLGPKMLWTIDAQVEGKHFDLGYAEGESIGHKALAVNLSDICAMGGVPRMALVSLGVRSGLEISFWEALYEGMAKLAVRAGVDIVGGNISATSGPAFIDISVLGECSRPLTRGGAKVGDTLFVTGELGGAARGLRLLRAKEGSSDPLAVRRQLWPEPRLKEALLLSQLEGVHALMDVSDGLTQDLGHLLKASNVGAEIDGRKLPIAAGSTREEALSGGEDYELLGTVAEKDFGLLEEAFLRAKLRITAIGKIVEASCGVSIRWDDGVATPLIPSGWDHLG